MGGRGRERGDLKIQWIMDNRKRKTTLKGRLPVVVNKAKELGILCGVPVCLVAYPPGEDEPVVWPSPPAARRVVRRYRGLPKLGGYRNKLNSTAFVKQMNDKARAKLCNVQLQRHDAEVKNVIVDYLAGRRGSFDDLPTDFFISLGMKVQDKLHAVNARLHQIRSAPALLLPAAAPGRDDDDDDDDVQMVQPLATMEPPQQQHVAMMMTPLMLEPAAPPQQQQQQQQQHDGPTPIMTTLDGKPRHGSYLFEVLDAFNGRALPTTDELHAVFLQAGIFSPPLPNYPSFHP